MDIAWIMTQQHALNQHGTIAQVAGLGGFSGNQYKAYPACRQDIKETEIRSAAANTKSLRDNVQ